MVKDDYTGKQWASEGALLTAATGNHHHDHHNNHRPMYYTTYSVTITITTAEIMINLVNRKSVGKRNMLGAHDLNDYYLWLQQNG